MTEAEAYIEVAERTLIAAEGALQRSIQAKGGFLAYHAFESAGGAFCRSRGISYPRGHTSKVNAFVRSVQREKFAKHVAELAIALGSLRNPSLYPESQQNGHVLVPRQVLTLAQAERLAGRVRALVKRIARVV